MPTLVCLRVAPQASPGIRQADQAIERRVQIHLLLDDVGSFALGGLPFDLAGVDNLEVRLFNPLAWRHHLWLGYLVNFRRAHRRMHSKLFIADDHRAIIGGRNMSDEYFAADSGRLFADLDALVARSEVDGRRLCVEVLARLPIEGLL